MIDDDKSDTKFSSLVGCFKHSNRLTEHFKNYFKANKQSRVSLKQNIVTRWNSSYRMIRSILSSYDAVRFVLNDPSNKEHRQFLLKDEEMGFLKSYH